VSTLNTSGWSRDLPIGAEVVTTDGDLLGTVREIQGDCFKLDVSMQPDYWLPMDCISSVSGNRILLDFPKDRLGDYKLSEPRAA
jgi:hypothetical protein